MIEEELMGLPKKWVVLLNSMPEVKEQFIEDKMINNELVPEYFLTYFAEDYNQCKEFFMCFENGSEVFENFIELYGESCNLVNKLSEEKVINLAQKHIKGIDNILNLVNESFYNINDISIKTSIEEEFEDNYDLDEIFNGDIERKCLQIVNNKLLPDENENFLAALVDALYEITQDYNLVYYILWPICKNEMFENPYKGYADLWKNNIKPYIIDENLVEVVK